MLASATPSWAHITHGIYRHGQADQLLVSDV